MLLASLFRRKPLFYRIFINVFKTDGSIYGRQNKCLWTQYPVGNQNSVKYCSKFLQKFKRRFKGDLIRYIINKLQFVQRPHLLFL